MKVNKIRNGTVIDHIAAGRSLDILALFELKEPHCTILAMNVPSKKFGTKDFIKIEGFELRDGIFAKIREIAPNATINIIRDYEVVDKIKF
jgi:aspartate carbamoyltransferase regulatory subunit